MKMMKFFILACASLLSISVLSVGAMAQTEADYKEAKNIFEALYSFGGQKHNTLKNEDEVIEALIRLNPENSIFTLRQVAAETGLNHSTVHRAINGRTDGKAMAKLGGLLAKCPFIQKGGKRGQFELQTDVQYIKNGNQTTEITRKENYNEDIYRVDVKALAAWKNHVEPVRLALAFRWEGKPS